MTRIKNLGALVALAVLPTLASAIAPTSFPDRGAQNQAVLLGATTWAAPVVASPTELAVAGLLHAFREEHLRSTNDLKVLELQIEASIGELLGNSSKATPRRVKELSKSYREYVNALKSGDVSRIMRTAAVFHNNAYTRSSMFTKAWKHMVKKNGSPVVSALVALSGKMVAAGAKA